MARIISASIDLDKIDKAKITVGKNGHRYYDIDISVNDQPNQYAQDVAITQPQTKEQRAAKTPKVFLGNGKTVWKSATEAAAVRTLQGQAATDGQAPPRLKSLTAINQPTTYPFQSTDDLPF